MTPYYADESVQLHHGDCLDVLRELPDASVDSVVCDPPYGLANTTPEQVADTLIRWINGERDYLPQGQGFMGKAWDAFVPPVAVWDDCLRVLKPGGHLLAFAGSRTHDLMTLAMRMAGFEIRDSIAWLYGSGFPKSLDVSKAIDKMRKDDPAWRIVGQWLKGYREAAGYATRAQFAPSIADGHKNLESAAANLSNWENGLSFPTWDRWLSLKALLAMPNDMDAEVWRLNGRKGTPGEAWDERPVTGLHVAGLATGASGVGGAGEGKERRDVPATPAAQQWQGWGTALKPAFEPIVVARKPLAGTVAANVLTHGTGALNIDGCRVGTGDNLGRPASNAGDCGSLMVHDGSHGKESRADSMFRYSPETQTHAAGRWPTNVVLDGHAAESLDAEVGTLKSGANPTRRSSDKFRDAYGDFQGQEECVAHRGADTGGASRFFPVFRYQAKAPTRERPSYVKDGAGEGRVIEGASGKVRQCNVCGNRTIRSGETAPACGHGDFSFVPTATRSDRIAHPTVKPLALMQWLVRLVTPPGGTVLEPFAGSGTTVEACLLEGFRCIAIEREADYLPLIEARVERQRKPDVPTAAEALALFDFEEPA